MQAGLRVGVRHLGTEVGIAQDRTGAPFGPSAVALAGLAVVLYLGREDAPRGILEGGTHRRVLHTEAGLEILCTRLALVCPAWIVMEVTGGLELPVAQFLSAAGHDLARVNSRQVWNFGRALG